MVSSLSDVEVAAPPWWWSIAEVMQRSHSFSDFATFVRLLLVASAALAEVSWKKPFRHRDQGWPSRLTQQTTAILVEDAQLESFAIINICNILSSRDSTWKHEKTSTRRPLTNDLMSSAVHLVLALASVRENLCNNSKKNVKVMLFGFSKKTYKTYV